MSSTSAVSKFEGQQRQAAGVGQQGQEAGERGVRALRRQQRDRLVTAQLRIEQQSGHARVGGDLGGEAQGLRPRFHAAFVARRARLAVPPVFRIASGVRVRADAEEERAEEA